MSLKSFVKAELSGWKKIEVVFLSFVFLFIFINAIIVKDNLIAVISAICGIMYSSIAGKGKVYCYYFGLAGSFCYSYLSFKNALWGNLLLYACYYVPMQITGIFAWRKHLKKDTQEIEKKNLTKIDRLKVFAFATVVCFLAIALLKLFGDKSPVFDGITTVLSIFGMYYTVKRCIEQWLIWIVVNGLSSIMWLKLVMDGANTWSTFIMWVVYFVLSVYFYIAWKKELQQTMSKNL